MSRAKRYSVDVTERQLEEIIYAVGYVLENGLGYGHIIPDQANIPEANRKRLYDKLYKLRTEVKQHAQKP